MFVLVQTVAAFPDGERGGNPAGAVVDASFGGYTTMAIALELVSAGVAIALLRRAPAAA